MEFSSKFALVTGASRGIGKAIAKALCDNHINIECFAQSLRQVNMQFVICREGYSDAIKALNSALCIE